VLEPDSEVVHPLRANRNAWIQVARGAVTVNGHDLNQGDGAAISAESAIAIGARERSEVLLFDLA
jgi:redox-sensitive bicupin YhaK (pirin superfamily)